MLKRQRETKIRSGASQSASKKGQSDEILYDVKLWKKWENNFCELLPRFVIIECQHVFEEALNVTKYLNEEALTIWQ